jgi:hypothetical protein
MSSTKFRIGVRFSVYQNFLRQRVHTTVLLCFHADQLLLRAKKKKKGCKLSPLTKSYAIWIVKVFDFNGLGYDVISSGVFSVGRDSAVRIATRYGLDGLGIKSRWRRDFPHSSRPALGHPASYTMRTGCLTGVKRPRRDVYHPSHLASRLKKE